MANGNAATAIHEHQDPWGRPFWVVVWYPNASKTEGPYDRLQMRRYSQKAAEELEGQLLAALRSGVDPDDVPGVLKSLGLSFLTKSFWTVLLDRIGRPPEPRPNV